MRELRCGHGSQILKRFLYVAKNIGGVDKVKGELFRLTPIGIDNLKQFYIKNGFEVGERYFVMFLQRT